MASRTRFITGTESGLFGAAEELSDEQIERVIATSFAASTNFPFGE